MMAYGYAKEELKVVRKIVSKALEERGIRAGRVEVMECCRFNLKAEIVLRGPTRSSNDLSHIARRVAETGLGAMIYVDGEELPLDFKIDMDEQGLRLSYGSETCHL